MPIISRQALPSRCSAHRSRPSCEVSVHENGRAQLRVSPRGTHGETQTIQHRSWGHAPRQAWCEVCRIQSQAQASHLAWAPSQSCCLQHVTRLPAFASCRLPPLLTRLPKPRTEPLEAANDRACTRIAGYSAHEPTCTHCIPHARQIPTAH
jgi:hypothetical protein